MEPEKKRILDRLKRIEGQVRGLERLIEEDAPCADILTQVSAVTSAVKKTGAAIISAHMESCLKDSREGRFKEKADFKTALARFIDLS